MSEQNGFLVLDKPLGWNSFKLVVLIRKIFGQKSVGFAGTLDPLASGMMILALGEYTKLLPYLEAKDKVYQVGIALDKISETMDSEGVCTVVDSNGKNIPTLLEIREKIKENFIGKVKQVPPKYSAIQINGQRAYEMARNGEDFEMKAREVEFFSIDILNYDFPDLNLEVHCSSGTYIRSLAQDLGMSLGWGGMVTSLKRLKIGQISLSDFPEIKLSMEGNLVDLKKVMTLLDVDRFFDCKYLLELNDEQYKILSLGNFLPVEKLSPEIIKWSNLNGDKPLLIAKYLGKTVGVIELVDVGDSLDLKLKFKKKFNIF